MFRRVALASVVLFVLSATSASAASRTVSIYNYYFSPATAKVAMGSSVQWTNTTGTKHSVSSDASFLWGTLTVKAHTTSSALLFAEAGTFFYHDSWNGTMHG